MAIEEELNRFKTDIHLPDFLVEVYGWEVYAPKTTRNSFNLRRGAGEVLVCEISADRHWTFFETNGDRSGSIIDYLLTFEGVKWPEIRHTLRPHLRGGAFPSPAPAPAPARDTAPADLDAVRRRWDQASPAASLPDYLAGRGFNWEVARLFTGAYRVDRHGNTLWPHTDDTGALTGFEVKGPGFPGQGRYSGFSKGGTRSLARLGPVGSPAPSRLVVTESAVDCLALVSLTGWPDALFLSTGGSGLSPKVRGLLRAIKERHPVPLLIASDNDEGGRRMAAQLVHDLASWDDVHVRHPRKTNDWTEMLERRAAVRTRLVTPPLPGPLRTSGPR